ncbi:MAG TPA: hypothetical protein VEL68_18675, partial [Thermodesulfobacteriota bacterium]|nr:hypothetical protein [Thermodesulfobacteriota bacterium]
FDVTLAPGEITEAEKEFRQSYHRMYDNDEWFFQKSTRRRFAQLPPRAKFSQFVYKVSGGPILRVNLAVLEDQVLDVLITGNMMPSRREIPEEIEQALRSAPAMEAEIEKIIRQKWEKEKMIVAGARVEDFITAVSGALRALS